MTPLEKSRQAWKSAYQQFGKGSKEELAAYHVYVSIQQGQGKKGKTRSYLTKGRK